MVHRESTEKKKRKNEHIGIYSLKIQAKCLEWLDILKYLQYVCLDHSQRTKQKKKYIEYMELDV